MATENFARFTISGSPSEDEDGHRGYDAEHGEVLTLEIEGSPGVVVQRLTYEIYDPDDPSSPQASLDVILNDLDNGTTTGRAVDAQPSPGSAVTLEVAGSGLPAFEIRAKANGGLGPDGRPDPRYVFTRLVAVRNLSGIRKIVPAEATQYDPRGWSDEQNRLVGIIDALAPTGVGLAVVLAAGYFAGGLPVVFDALNNPGVPVLTIAVDEDGGEAELDVEGDLDIEATGDILVASDTVVGLLAPIVSFPQGVLHVVGDATSVIEGGTGDYAGALVVSTLGGGATGFVLVDGVTPILSLAGEAGGADLNAIGNLAIRGTTGILVESDVDLRLLADVDIEIDAEGDVNVEAGGTFSTITDTFYADFVTELYISSNDQSSNIYMAQGDSIYYNAPDGCAHFFSVDGDQVGIWNANRLEVNVPYIRFGAAVTTPIIEQLPVGDAAGFDTILRAQGNASATLEAGSLVLGSGINSLAGGHGDIVIMYGSASALEIDGDDHAFFHDGVFTGSFYTAGGETGWYLNADAGLTSFGSAYLAVNDAHGADMVIYGCDGEGSNKDGGDNHYWPGSATGSGVHGAHVLHRNVAIGDAPASWQGMTGGAFFANGTDPGGNPTGGYYFFANSTGLYVRSPGGDIQALCGP